jgi:hypothetical protein
LLAIRNRTNCQLRLPWRTDFAHQHKIKRSGEGARNFIADHDAAAW